MAHKDCYLFTFTTNEHQRDYRKRRKLAHAKPGNGITTKTFVPLMRGNEDDDAALTRCDVFESIWKQQEAILDKIINNANKETIKSLEEFTGLSCEKEQHSKIPTGLLLHGPESGAFTGVSESLSNRLSSSRHTLCIRLDSGCGLNLKTILKYINRAATKQSHAGDDTTSRGSPKLSYDLQILCDQVHERCLRNVVLLFEDSEAFDGGLISDLIDILSCWKDRIPFVLLFGIATSCKLFQSNLSRSAIRSLEGRQFDIERADPEELLKMIHREPRSIFLGSGLCKSLVDRQKDFIQSPQSLIQAIKFAYMTQFFSNPFSSMLAPKETFHIRDHEHSAAIRQLPSFRRLVQREMDFKNYSAVRKLLDDDEELEEIVIRAAEETPGTLTGIVSAVDLIYHCVHKIAQQTGKSLPKWSELYILAMSNQLSKSSLCEETFASLRRANSSLLKDILKSISKGAYGCQFRVSQLGEELTKITSNLSDETNLRSSHDSQHLNLRTTVIAQKVELSRHAAKVTAQEAAYTKVIDKFIAELEGFIESRLIDPHELFLHEAFIYDVKSLHREVFTPHPRFATERALSSSHDYLGCGCCDSAAGGLSASQPATAIVYQLYLETGSTINIADLWSAFWTIMGPEESEDMEVEREKALALFSRALAELEYLGMIKNSRKRPDHLAKLLWKGL